MKNQDEHGTTGGCPTGQGWVAITGLVAGTIAVLCWAGGMAGYGPDITVPPLAGALVGWGLWKLDYGQVGEPRPVPVRVRRLPPDLPREFR